MRLPTEMADLRPRQSRPARGSRNNIIFTVAIAVLTGAVLLFFVYLSTRRLRIRYVNPRYIPTQYLKRKWRAWNPGGVDGRRYRRTSSNTVESLPTDAGRGQAETESTVAGVDRHTSIRSIATLPAYKPTAGESERILGREGERAGIDVVVEFPETAEEEEARRDEHMETLFQIRQARRAENAEREDRRRRRREARERGDTETLEAIRMESRAAREQRARAESAASNRSLVLPSLGTAPGASSNTSLPLSVLSVDQATRLERERRISSVSYAAVGLARHDGTRVRASSDSERPLLEGAGPIGIGGAGSRPNSPFNPSWTRPAHTDAPHAHRRDSSMHSISTNGSAGGGVADSILRPPHSRSASQTTMMTMSDVDLGEGNRASSPLPSSLHAVLPAEADIGDQPAPPDYDQLIQDDLSEIHHEEEAPSYETVVTSNPTSAPATDAGRETEGPPPPPAPPEQAAPVERLPTVRTRAGAPQLPALRALPSIEITEGTPVNSRPTSPVRRL